MIKFKGALALLPLLVAFVAAGDVLEPTVHKLHKAVPVDLCQSIIHQAEEHGFDMYADSIDENDNDYTGGSQEIDVLDHGEVLNAPLWKLIQPLIPKMTQLVSERETDTCSSLRDSKAPSVDWVFIRKYSPNTERNSLKLHRDINMHTLNIALNDEYEGGGLFYVKPPCHQVCHVQDASAPPDIPNELKTYEWLSQLQRKNTSSVIFPLHEVGDGLLHNYTVWHAVAPLTSGQKYSLVFFFDMNHTAVHEITKEVGEDLEEGEDSFIAFFHHEEVEDKPVDLYWVDDDDQLYLVEKGLGGGESIWEELTHGGHRFQAILRNTGEIVADFAMDPDIMDYYVSHPEL